MNKIFLILFSILSSQTLAFQPLCRPCLWICEWQKKKLRSDKVINEQLKKYYDTCIKKSSKEYCQGRITNELPYEYRAAVSKYNCDEECKKYWLCSDIKFEKDTTKSFAGKHLSRSRPFTSYEGLAPNKSKPLKFLVVADIHMDFDYEPVVFEFIYRVGKLFVKNLFVVVRVPRRLVKTTKNQANTAI